MNKAKGMVRGALVLLFLLLTGCGDIDGEIPGKEEVLSFMQGEVPGEHYVFDRVQSEEGALPQKDIYYFKSTDRELEFTAVSTLSAVGMDATIAGYKPCIYSQYPAGVHSLYSEEIDAILEELPRDSQNVYCYDSYDDLARVASIIIRADEVYKQELAYNTQEWMNENPIKTISVRYIYTGEDGKENFVTTVYAKLNGNLDFDEIYNRFCDRHKELVKEKGLE